MKRRILFMMLLSSTIFLTACGKDDVPEVIQHETVSESPSGGTPTVPTTVEVVEPVMSMEAAKLIAESDCIKDGETMEPGSYNPNSKTWWFNANVNDPKEGCNPACVVSEDGSSEINWRCTGLAS